MWKDWKLSRKRAQVATWFKRTPFETSVLIRKRRIRELHSRYSFTSNWKGVQSNNDSFNRHLNWLFVASLLASTAPSSIYPKFQPRFYAHLQLGWMLVSYVWLCLSAFLEFVNITFCLSDLERLLYGVESLTYILHIAYIMFLAWQWRQRVQTVFTAIAQFDLEMGYIENCERSKHFVQLQLWLVGILGVSAFIIDFGYHKWNLCKWLLSIGTYVLPNVISSVSFVQYYVLLQGVAWRLQKINQFLRQELFSFDPNCKPQRPTVQKLRGLQAQLIRFTKSVNRVYEVSILFVYVGSFVNFNLNLFLAYKTIDRPETSGWFWWSYMILWLGMHMGKMFSILFFNHLVQLEQSNCLALMFKVRLSDSHHLIESCKHFVLQLQTRIRENVVCGVIQLDLQFITALTMATTNVFIFLLQYDITFEALSKPSNDTKTV